MAEVDLLKNIIAELRRNERPDMIKKVLKLEHLKDQTEAAHRDGRVDVQLKLMSEEVEILMSLLKLNRK